MVWVVGPRHWVAGLRRGAVAVLASSLLLMLLMLQRGQWVLHAPATSLTPRLLLTDPALTDPGHSQQPLRRLEQAQPGNTGNCASM